MKFAHLADCHIGGWRDPKLRAANTNSFCMAIEKCLTEKVDFVLISGDLFNTAVPSIDSLRMTVEQLKRVKDAKIPVYFIAGSHDFSPSGKTMLDVLEHAGLAMARTECPHCPARTRRDNLVQLLRRRSGYGVLRCASPGLHHRPTAIRIPWPGYRSARAITDRRVAATTVLDNTRWLGTLTSRL